MTNDAKVSHFQRNDKTIQKSTRSRKSDPLSVKCHEKSKCFLRNDTKLTHSRWNDTKIKMLHEKRHKTDALSVKWHENQNASWETTQNWRTLGEMTRKSKCFMRNDTKLTHSRWNDTKIKMLHEKRHKVDPLSVKWHENQNVSWIKMFHEKRHKTDPLSAKWHGNQNVLWETTHKAQITTGVSEGSILGPLLTYTLIIL